MDWFHDSVSLPFHQSTHRPVNEKQPPQKSGPKTWKILWWWSGIFWAKISLHIPLQWGPQITLSKYGFSLKTCGSGGLAPGLCCNLRSWGYLSASSVSHPNWCNKVPVLSGCNWPYIHTTLQGFILYRDKGGFKPIEKICSNLSFGVNMSKQFFQTTT